MTRARLTGSRDWPWRTNGEVLMMATVLAGFLAGTTPQKGDVAPDFQATDTDGKVHVLSELVKRGPVIVAFFPKAFTGG